MKLYYNGEEVGDIYTRDRMTVKQALYLIGYDLDYPEDLERAYDKGFPAAYIDDEGSYCIDVSNIKMIYSMFDSDAFGSDCPDNWEEIVNYLNQKLATTYEDENDIFEKYVSGDYSDAPAPIFRDKE